MIYEPAEDSYLLASVLHKYVKNKSVLDMGSGSGILAETAINSGAKSVLAADINTNAVKLIKSKKIKAVQSDLFDNIKKTKVAGLLETSTAKLELPMCFAQRAPAGGCRFDIIIFNPPYLPEDKREPQDSKLSTTGGKKGDEIIIKFLKQAKSHLNKNGKILLLLSSLTPKNKILNLIKNLNLKYKRIKKQKLFFEILYIWEISPQ